jgi:PAS domain-containing protein
LSKLLIGTQEQALSSSYTVFVIFQNFILQYNFCNRALRRIFGSKRDEVAGGWRKLHNKELRNLYSSPSIIRMIKSRRMRWAGHVTGMGRRGMHIGYPIGGKARRKETTTKTTT